MPTYSCIPPQVYELKQGGVEQVVTRDNHLEYIYLVGHYKLNVQLHRQFQCFREGLEQVIPAHWLRLFSQGELQVLVSGAPVPIDLDDLKMHTNYRGGMSHPPTTPTGCCQIDGMCGDTYWTGITLGWIIILIMVFSYAVNPLYATMHTYASPQTTTRRATTAL